MGIEANPDAGVNSNVKHPDLLALAVVVILTCIVMWQRWTYDNWLAQHDLLTFFLPWFGALGDRLRDFDIPALNPYIFSGAPFAGDPESGWTYVPAMLLFPFFEVTVAYKLMVLLLFVLAGTSTYGLARLLGYNVAGALFAALSFEFGPILYQQTNCCSVGSMLSVFFPLAFMGVELAIRATSWRGRITAWVLGGFAISQMFAAWLGQGAINSLLIVAAWMTFRTLISPPDPTCNYARRVKTLLWTGTGVVVMGLMLGAAGILPRLAANAESNLAGGDYSSVQGGGGAAFHTFASAMNWMVSDDMLLRGFSVWGVVFVLMILAPFLSHGRSVIPFFALVAVLIPALAMGVSVISDAFYLIPKYEEFHVHSPRRIMWLLPFIAAMLAGGAVSELWRLPLMRYKWIISFVPFALVSFAALQITRQLDIRLGFWAWATVIVTTIMVLFAAAAPILNDTTSQQRSIQRPLVLLVALTFVLPSGVDLVNTVRQDDPPPGELELWGNDPWMQDLIEESLARTDPGGAGEFLQRQQETQQPFRFIAYGGYYHPLTVELTYPNRRFEPDMVAILQNSRPMRLGLETTQGYNPLQPLVYQEFMTILNRKDQNYHFANLLNTGVNSPLLDLLNVRYIVVDRNIPENRDDHRALAEIRTEVYRDENLIVYESPSVQPRAWIVYDVRSGANGAGLAALANGEVDGAEVAFVDGELPNVSVPAGGAESRVTISNWSPDSMTLNIAHSGEGLLVVSQVYSENWQATVNGEEVDVIQTDHALLGIPVGAGEHTVDIRYQPDSLTLGLWISGLSGVGCIAILGYAGWHGWSRRWWKRRSRYLSFRRKKKLPP